MTPRSAICYSPRPGGRQGPFLNDFLYFFILFLGCFGTEVPFRAVLRLLSKGHMRENIDEDHHENTALARRFSATPCAKDAGKADSTLRSSQAAPHPSTNRALRRLTSEVRRDPVYSTWYGRQRRYIKATAPWRPPPRFGKRNCSSGGCLCCRRSGSSRGRRGTVAAAGV